MQKMKYQCVLETQYISPEKLIYHLATSPISRWGNKAISLGVGPLELYHITTNI